MLRWLPKKIQSWRLANWNIQLAMELKKLTTLDTALVVVKSIHFCLSFRHHDNGDIMVKVIEEPSKHLLDEGARELYGKLEDMLFAAQKQRTPTLRHAKANFPPSWYNQFAKSVELNHVALRLLMSRVSHAFKAADSKYIEQVSNCLRVALPLIDDAVILFKSDERILGTTEDSSYYTLVRDMAYKYAATYPL